MAHNGLGTTIPRAAQRQAPASPAEPDGLAGALVPCQSGGKEVNRQRRPGTVIGNCQALGHSLAIAIPYFVARGMESASKAARLYRRASAESTRLQ